MKKLTIFAVVLVLASIAIAYWLFAAPSVSVGDVRQAETLVLGKETGGASTYGISIRGSGYIDGEATITLQLRDGTAYRIEKLKGTVDFEWGDDWYSDTAEVRYEPTDVRSGKIVLHYRFLKL